MVDQTAPPPISATIIYGKYLSQVQPITTIFPNIRFSLCFHSCTQLITIFNYSFICSHFITKHLQLKTVQCEQMFEVAGEILT
jgi:hypothetical protein